MIIRTYMTVPLPIAGRELECTPVYRDDVVEGKGIFRSFLRILVRPGHYTILFIVFWCMHYMSVHGSRWLCQLSAVVSWTGHWNTGLSCNKFFLLLSSKEDIYTILGLFEFLWRNFETKSPQQRLSKFINFLDEEKVVIIFLWEAKKTTLF